MHELIEFALSTGAKGIGKDPFRRVVVKSSGNYPAGAATVYSAVDAVEAAISRRWANAQIIGPTSTGLSPATGKLPAIHLT